MFLDINMLQSLAIVIPAYKSTFLAATLDSIEAQTCKDFTVYIGDDHSPDNLEKIVERYSDKFQLVYKKFDTNLGGKDLVSQWERCVDMTQGEEWLWVFSDDDVMEPNCVEEFYNFLEKNKIAKLIHFNIKPIDSKGEIISRPTPYPEFITVKQYLDGKLSIDKTVFISYVVEFIVHRDIYYSTGRFQNYDLAWGSDMVTWVKFADAAKGIYTIPNAYVRWRSSGQNISTDNHPDIIYRKLKSVIAYMKWILCFSQKNDYGHPFRYSKYALGEIMRNRKIVGIRSTLKLMKDYWKSISGYRFGILRDLVWVRRTKHN